MQSTALANRVREVVLNGKWIANTNFKEQLSGYPWKEAVEKKENFNTIALLAFHIHYYIKGVLQVLEGGTLDIKDAYSFDMPAIQNQEDWDRLLDAFWVDAEAFSKAVEQLSDAQLQVGFVDERYGTYQRNIEAIIEHSYYHLGQIVLIKKMKPSES